MNKVYKFSMSEHFYVFIRLENAKFARNPILISSNLPFLEWRIERAMKKLIKREELYKKYFNNE